MKWTSCLSAVVQASLLLSLVACVLAAPNGVPSQVRIAVRPNGMSVSWTTNSSYGNVKPFVMHGNSVSNLTLKAEGSSSTYGTSWFHNVELKNLKSATTYYYKVHGVRGPFSFQSPRAAGDNSPYSVLFIGDMGLVNSDATKKAVSALKGKSDFIYHIGDVGYADDWYLRKGDTYEGSWDKYMDWVEDITSTKAYMTLPGNHEATCTEVTPQLCPAHEKNFTAYRHRFSMPNVASGGIANMFYSFDYGLVHYVQLSSETDFPGAPSGPGTWLNGGPFGDQISWLKKDLAKAVANRAKVPWIVVGAHRPFYTSHGKGCAPCLKAFWDLMTQANVDLYFTAHVHWYERLYPINADGKVLQKDYNNPTVPVQIVNGCAGNIEGHETTSKVQDFTANLDMQHYGYGRLDVVDHTHLKWNFFNSADQSLVDSITIVKHH